MVMRQKVKFLIMVMRQKVKFLIRKALRLLIIGKALTLLIKNYTAKKEMDFCRQIVLSSKDLVVVQGLPSTLMENCRSYFQTGSLAFGKSLKFWQRLEYTFLRLSGSLPRLVFICLSSDMATRFGKQFAESYNISDIAGIDRELEITAYEKAHRAIADSLSSLDEADRDLALLNSSDDLPIVAMSYHLPAVLYCLKEQRKTTKLVVPQTQNDDSYKVLSANSDILWAQITENFISFKLSILERGYLGVSNSMQKNLSIPQDKNRYWTDISALHDSVDCSVVDAVSNKDEIVLICVKHSLTHFSYETIWRLAEELERVGAQPVLVSEGEELVASLSKQHFPVLDLNAILLPEANSLEKIVGNFKAYEWPYDQLQQTAGWQKRLTAQLERVAKADALISQLNPRSLVCYPYGTQIGRALRLAAKWNDVRSYTPYLLGVAGHARGFPVIDKDTNFLVYGDEAFEGLINFGVSDRQVTVTGNPRYDTIPNHVARRDEYRQFLLGEDADKVKLVLVATTGLIGLDRLWLDAAGRSADELGFELIIKPHPSLDPEEYTYWDQTFENVSVWQGDLNEAASACDCLITDYSSTGWEAILYNKPLIVVNFSENEFAYRWEDEGVGSRASNEQELHSQLQDIVKGHFSPEILEKQRRIISRYNYKNDGRAVERIAKILIS